MSLQCLAKVFGDISFTGKRVFHRSASTSDTHFDGKQSEASSPRWDVDVSDVRVFQVISPSQANVMPDTPDIQEKSRLLYRKVIQYSSENSFGLKIGYFIIPKGLSVLNEIFNCLSNSRYAIKRGGDFT